ncbi:chaperone protein HscA [Alphaproteobacteria bacterium]|nr:chaperone protein HscA [Alphaproteobacteria bacterium]GHS99661.1 chaperone protein HscA [Alphaproteobacteria bacterium]
MVRLLGIGESSPTALPSFGVGIDLGTTFSVVACAENQKATVLDLLGGQDLIPSVLTEHFELAASPKEGYYYNFKNIMETPDSPALPYAAAASLPTAVDVSTALLKNLKNLAEKKLKWPLERVVITVPARFSDVARKATKKAAQQAGFSVLRLLNEPTAAALAYGLQRHSKAGLYLVYDLGGGTFDATLLRIEENIFQILATAGDLHLGGNTIDAALLEKMGRDPTLPQNWFEVRALKEHYNNSGEASSPLLPFESFEQSVGDVVQKTVAIVKKILTDTQTAPADIQDVLLVGGSTRLRPVFQAMRALFGAEKILNSLDPDRTVALGAALQAEALTQGHSASRPLLLDILPSSLGMETLAGCVENIIPKYTPTPIRVTMTFSTAYNNQTEVLIHIVQGESLYVEQCRSLGRFILKGIRPMPKETPIINVTFAVDDDGILSICASEEISGTQKKMTIETHLG